MRPVRKVRRTLAVDALAKRAGGISTVNALRTVWITAIAWYEFGVFYWSVAQCVWPGQEFKYADKAEWKDASRHTTHVVLIADPQVLDGYSYPERGYLLGLLSQFIVDLNMRKSWSAVRRMLLQINHESREDGDAVVFLGDMMDNGRNAYTDAEYERYFSRFKSIFQTDPSVKSYYIPGNHDVGLGSSKAFSPHVRSRYIKHFGSLNYKVALANHTLVMLDAPSLVEEDYRRASAGQRFEDWRPPPNGVVSFINEFASVGTEYPVVLFSHIPLSRPDTASCGPLREKGSIRRGVGFGYQNTLGRQTSAFILKSIQPDIIFSGDDHDYCEYTHSIPLLTDGPEPRVKSAREVTVKSFSIAMGVRNPGFQLLSLANPSSLESGTPSYADSPCFLPDQIAIYLTRYLPLFLLTLCVLAINTLRRLTDRVKRSREYNLDIDPNDISLIQSSPEIDFPGTLGSARVPNSGSFGNGGFARSYRASSASFVATPNTPEFTTIPEGRAVTPGLLGALPAGLGAVPGDAEMGFLRHIGDDEGDNERETSEGAFFGPSARTQQRKRRFTWSWSFVLRGRRRRITIGIPTLVEQTFFRIIQTLFRQDVRTGLFGTRRSSKVGHHAPRDDNALLVFVDEFLRTAWPAVLCFVFVNVYLFR